MVVRIVPRPQGSQSVSHITQRRAKRRKTTIPEWFCSDPLMFRNAQGRASIRQKRRYAIARSTTTLAGQAVALSSSASKQLHDGDERWTRPRWSSSAAAHMQMVKCTASPLSPIRPPPTDQAIRRLALVANREGAEHEAAYRRRRHQSRPRIGVASAKKTAMECQRAARSEPASSPLDAPAQRPDWPPARRRCASSMEPLPGLVGQDRRDRREGKAGKPDQTPQTLPG